MRKSRYPENAYVQILWVSLHSQRSAQTPIPGEYILTHSSDICTFKDLRSIQIPGNSILTKSFEICILRKSSKGCTDTDVQRMQIYIFFGYLHPLQRSPQYTNLRRFLINTKSSKICILQRPLKGVQIPKEYVDLHSLDICVCATF